MTTLGPGRLGAQGAVLPCAPEGSTHLTGLYLQFGHRLPVDEDDGDQDAEAPDIGLVGIDVAGPDRCVTGLVGHQTLGHHAEPTPGPGDDLDLRR